MTFISHHFRPWVLAAWGAGAALLASPVPALAQQTQQVTHPEARFQEGVRLYQRTLYGPAQAAFREYLAEPAVRDDAERAADARYYAAVSGLRLLQPDAEGQILNFARSYPAHPKAALAYFELGRFYFERKDYESAITYLKQSAPDLLTSQQRYESEFKLAYSYFSTKQYDQARVLFDRNKTAQHPWAPAAHYYAGFLEYRAGDYDASQKDLIEAGKSPAYKTVVPQLLTAILYKRRDLAGVISYGESALAMKPQGADEIQLLVGDAYFSQEDYAKALPPLLAAAGKPGVGRGAKSELLVEYKAGYAAFKTQDYATAVARLQPVAAQRDTLGQFGAYHLGLSYLKQSNKPFALTSFEQARLPSYDSRLTEQATLKVGEINYEDGNARGVIAALSDFNKQFPKSKQMDGADDMLSDAYLNSSDYAAAVRHIERMGDKRSSRLNQTYQRVTYYQAIQEYNAGHPELALPLLDKSLQYPADPQVRSAASFLKGESLSALGRWEEAIQAYVGVYRTVAAAGETDWFRLSRYGLGYAYYNAKQYEAALGQFKSYIEDPGTVKTDPMTFDATVRLADTYYVAKDYDQAVKLYDEVLAQKGPNQDVAIFQKGVTLGLAGRREEAVATLSRIPREFPQSPYVDNALFQQAQFEFEAGRYGPAVLGFTNLLTQTPTSGLVPQALVKRGVAYSNQQQFDNAVADFRKILDDYPNSKVTESALYSLQEALAAANRPEEFDPYLQTYKQRNPGAKSLETVEYEAAKALYFAEKYELAAPKFESFLRQFPNNAAAPDARYFIADAHVRGGDKKNGLRLMTEAVQEGKTQYMNKAVKTVADLSYDMQDYATANQYYQRLASAATSRRDVATAQLGQLRTAYAINDYARTRQVAGDILAAGGATVNATNLALLYRAKASLAMGQNTQAVEELRAATKNVTDENGAEAQYLLAKHFYDQKQYKEALDEAFKVNQNYAGFAGWVGRAFLLLADTYAAQGETYQARGTLESLINNKFPVPEVLEQAKQKLAKLNASGKTDAGEDDKSQTGNPKRRAAKQNADNQDVETSDSPR